ISLDMSQTNLHGQFYTESNQQGTLNGLPLFVNEQVNLARTRYQTLSAQLTHDTPRGWYSQLQFGFTRGYIVELPAGFYNQPPLCTVCANLGALTNINYSGSPYSQGFGMVGYRWASRRSIDLETTYYGPNNAYYRPAFFVVD